MSFPDFSRWSSDKSFPRPLDELKTLFTRYYLPVVGEPLVTLSWQSIEWYFYSAQRSPWASLGETRKYVAWSWPSRSGWGEQMVCFRVWLCSRSYGKSLLGERSLRWIRARPWRMAGRIWLHQGRSPSIPSVENPWSKDGRQESQGRVLPGRLRPRVGELRCHKTSSEVHLLISHICG